MIRGPEFRLVARKSGRSESGEARYARQHSTRQDPILATIHPAGDEADQNKIAPRENSPNSQRSVMASVDYHEL